MSCRWYCGCTTRPQKHLRQTPFALTFSIEVVIPAEVRVPSYRVEACDETKISENEEALPVNLDLLE